VTVATVDELQERLDALRKIRAGGTKLLQTADGKRIEYRTDGEIAAAIADLERQIAGASRSAVRTTYITGSKGV